MALLSLSPDFLIRHGLAPGLSYFTDFFSRRLLRMVEQITATTRPSLIIVCMIYYPQIEPDPASWASVALNALGYDRNPAKLQLILRTLYERARPKLQLPGTAVVPFPLFEVLDGTDANDYRHRVEPSRDGGRKMADAFLRAINSHST